MKLSEIANDVDMIAQAGYWDVVKRYATDKQKEYLDLSHLHSPKQSHAAAARLLGIDRRGVDRGIAAAVRKAAEAGAVLAQPDDLKIALLDIETAPLLSYIWGMWQEVRSHDFIDREWYMLSYSYKWLGQDTIYSKILPQTAPYRNGDEEDDSELVTDLWNLLDEADIIIAHNGDKFDVKKIKTRMMQQGLPPPSPFITIDTLKILKREFGFTSNALDAVCKVLFGEGKIDNGGIELWRGCLGGNMEAWKLLRAYNERDVGLLEKLYMRIRAWDRSHPNVLVGADLTVPACTVCGSTNITKLDSRVNTKISSFTAYECDDCGHNMRDRRNMRSKEAMEVTLVNAR